MDPNYNYDDLKRYDNRIDNRQPMNPSQGLYRVPSGYGNQAKELAPPLLHHGAQPWEVDRGNMRHQSHGMTPRSAVESMPYGAGGPPSEMGGYGRYGGDRSYEPPSEPYYGGGAPNAYTPTGSASMRPVGGYGGPGRSMGRDNYRGQQMMQAGNPAMGGMQGMGGMANQRDLAGSNAQGRAVNKMLLDILRERVIDPQRLNLAIETFVDRMDCVNLATLLFHTGKKRLTLSPIHIKQIADRFNVLNEELRAREASNALYGLKCLSSEIPEVRELVYALARKIALSASEFVAQAVGNALYGLQMMSSEYEEIRYLVLVLSMKVGDCTELLEAQNVGNALYGLRGMSSDYKEVRALVSALTPKIANAREDLNGQALGNSLYGLQSMSSKEPEVRMLLSVLATKVTRTWEELKAQEVGNALYGLKRMSSDIPEVRMLISALVPKIASSPELLDAQAIGNSFYGLQNMNTHSAEVLSLVGVLADKVALSNPELDGQAMGNSLYGLQGMSSDYQEVRNAVAALTVKIQHSMLEMNAQELGNALYGMQSMNSNHAEVRRLLLAMAQKVSASKHELGSQEIGNAMFGLQGMSSEHTETRIIVAQVANKIRASHSMLDPQGVSNSLFGLQRLSSESQEVKALIQALAQKVEHCWKALSAHHIAYACYGLQQLGSDSNEVRFLLKTLVAKILACREEMTTKQISYALYGLRNMMGDVMEVLAMITAITEKINLTSDQWNGQNLSLALFGLQGFHSDSEEVALLLNVLVAKSAGISLDLDQHSLGNAFFGLQRLKTTNVEVIKLLQLLYNSFERLAVQPELISPIVSSNVLIGLQGKSVAQDVVVKMLQGTYNCIRNYVERIKLYTQRTELTPDIFHEFVRLYQCAALNVFSLQDVPSVDQQEESTEIPVPVNPAIELLNSFSSLLAEMETMIEENQKLARSYPLSIAESNLIHDVVSALPKETSSIQSSVLYFGFDVAILVKLFTSAAKTDLETQLILEVVGTSYTLPSKELFYSLRNQYLEKKLGTVVVSMSAELFAMPGQQGLIKQFNLMNTVLTSGLEDSPDLSKRVNSLQKIVNYVQRVNPLYLPGTEYVDDEISLVQPTNVHEQMRLKINVDGIRRPFGLMIGWVGMLPFFHSFGAPGSPSPTNANAQSQSFGRTSAVPPPQSVSPQMYTIQGKHTPRTPAVANIPGSRLSGAYQPTQAVSPSMGPMEVPTGYRPNSGEFNKINPPLPPQQLGEEAMQSYDERPNAGNFSTYGSGHFSTYQGNTHELSGQVVYNAPEEVNHPIQTAPSTFVMPDIRINTDPLPPNSAAGKYPSGHRYPSRSPMASAITPRQQMNMVALTPIPESGSVDTVVHGETTVLPEDKGLRSLHGSAVDLKSGLPQEPEDVEIMEARMEIARLEKKIKELMVKKSTRLAAQSAGFHKARDILSAGNDNVEVNTHVAELSDLEHIQITEANN